MYAITDADRVAAEELRVLLADVSGFWHVHGDTGPICLALARHRELAEQRMREQMLGGSSRGSVVALKVASREAPNAEREHKRRADFPQRAAG